MRNRIKAWWWRDKVNVGDCLTPYIINKLSGMEVIHIGYSLLEAARYILKRLKAGLPIDYQLIRPIYLFEPEYILGVGSILNHKSHKKAIVWGSGFIKASNLYYGKKLLAVRGQYSAERLVELGYPMTEIWGDPALLLPMIYRPKNITRKGTLAIVPNFSEYEKFEKQYGSRFDVINLNTSDIEHIIDLLCSYDYILSTSLHGLIISHAYGIPAIWIEDVVLVDDYFHFKFRDYFSSVGIPYYEPYRNIEELLNSNMEFFFKENQAKYMLNRDLKHIQRDLLSVAPFPVKSEFKNYSL